MHAHLPRTMSKHLVPVFEFHAEHRIGKGLYYCPFKNNRILFRLCQIRLLILTTRFASIPQMGRATDA